MQFLQDSKRNYRNHLIKSAETISASYKAGPQTNCSSTSLVWLCEVSHPDQTSMELSKMITLGNLNTSLGDRSLTMAILCSDLYVFFFFLLIAQHGVGLENRHAAIGNKSSTAPSTSASLHIEPLLQCSEGLKNQPPKCLGEPWQVTSPFQ